MYSNLSLYYLEHLGIKPWIRRTEGLQKKKMLLIVLLDGSLSSKARCLLDKLLDFIRLDKADKPLILTEVPDPAILKRCRLYQGLIVLNFRQDHSSDVLEELKGSELSTLDMSSPDVLLTHPAEKKKVFQQLSNIKALLES